MSFKNATTLVRCILLLAFILALLGPWTFDQINVPAQYVCDKPFVRLEGDFCGYPMSGLETIKWFGGGVFSFFGDLVNGNFAARIPDLVALIGVLIIILIVILPFFSTLLLFGNQNSRRLQTLNMIAWGLAGLLPLSMFISQINREQVLQSVSWLWGAALYVLLAAGTILFELLARRSSITPGMRV